MDFWMLIATLLHTAGLLAFVGGLLWFSILFRWADRSGDERASAFADQAFRITSLGMSVGLTALIGGGLLRYYLLHGDFRWGAGSTPAWLDLAKILAFLGLWLAWGWLEVVIMHGLRKESPGPDGSISEAYAASRSRARRSLSLQLLLAVAILLLSVARQVLNT